jgi:hypothetical protein
MQGLTVITFSTLYDVNYTSDGLGADGHLRGCLDGTCGFCFSKHCFTLPEVPMAIVLSGLVSGEGRGERKGGGGKGRLKIESRMFPAGVRCA